MGLTAAILLIDNEIRPELSSADLEMGGELYPTTNYT